MVNETAPAPSVTAPAPAQGRSAAEAPADLAVVREEEALLARVAAHLA